MNEQLEKIISFDFDSVFVPEIFSSLLIILVLLILSLAVFISSRKYIENPLLTPKGIFNIACLGVEKAEDLTVGIMGEKNRGFSAYIVPLFVYLFFAFIFGLTGLPSPMTYFGVPLTLSLITFVMIHVQAVKTNKWKYFKRYIEPIPIFLPVNLVTMWAPLLSMSLRMFGNAISGYCLMSLVYYGLENLSMYLLKAIDSVQGGFDSVGLGPQGLLLSWVGTPILHAYFDLFSGFIQTLVFSMLTMINIYQEQNEEDSEQMIERIQNQ